MTSGNPRLDELHRHALAAGGGLYLGLGNGGLAFAGPEQAVLVLGPPRSGKTSTLVIPNVLAAPGAVVSTSTKPDVLAATFERRARLGRCWLLDPTGTVPTPAGVTRIRWSPIAACASWDATLPVARAMVGATRAQLRHGEAAHWTERAEAMLAPLLHAAALAGGTVGGGTVAGGTGWGGEGLAGGDMAQVVHWVLRQDLDTPRRILEAKGVELGADVLSGLAATDGRELSGIFSTTAGVLAAYRSEAALGAARDPNFDPRLHALGADTVYVCAPARNQALAAPIVVAFVEQLRASAFALSATGASRPPVVLALDEAANVAPLPDLPSLVSEGGGQGVLTLACFQDLSQARARWGPEADGFLSLFGTKVVLGGIADLQTLELVSRLGGEVDLPVKSVSQSSWWRGGTGAPTTTWSTRRQRRFPVDAVNQQPPHTAMVLSGSRAPAWVSLRRWQTLEPFAPLPSPPLQPAALPSVPAAARAAGRTRAEPGWEPPAPGL